MMKITLVAALSMSCLCNNKAYSDLKGSHVYHLFKQSTKAP